MRKTNLFYLEDDNNQNMNSSNFLTFSNYGEFLTGVCLSVNHKIWPSSFLCLDLPFADNKTYNDGIGSFDISTSNKYTLDNFKHFLMCYYENKLAWLRDDYENQDKKQEELNTDNRLLNFLLEAILLFFKDNENLNNTLPITYFGDIVEHDYNGSYNDSMCIVDFNRMKNFNVTYLDSNYKVYEKHNTTLHNWNTELTKSIYYAIYDNNDNTYNDSNFVTFSPNNDNDIEDKWKLSFNCIIPLFDIINDNISENNDQINENNESNDSYKYIPYGIWFASENEDGTLNNIELHKENDNISQSWSLVICSKFSPYPLGVKINDTVNNTDNLIEKYTYAELLAEQSKLLEIYNELSAKINILSNKLTSLSTDLNNIKQLYPQNGITIVDDINEKFNRLEANVNKNIDVLREQFEQYTEQFKWKQQ